MYVPQYPPGAWFRHWQAPGYEIPPRTYWTLRGLSRYSPLLLHHAARCGDEGTGSFRILDQKWLSFSLPNSVNRMATMSIAYQNRTGWWQWLLLLLLLPVLLEMSVFQDRETVELFWLLLTRSGWSWCWCCCCCCATSTPASSPATTTAATTWCLTATTRRTRRRRVGGGGGCGCRGSGGGGGGGARLLNRLSWGPPVHSEVSFWGILDGWCWRRQKSLRRLELPKRVGCNTMVLRYATSACSCWHHFD